ncbi:BQ2448_7764 [Microbotryum intermedium]|uniref:Derlin n=1 Tax=Microbotryum intermedium TaxID=269621 RepID=A0A238FNH7_9BASI|nr:BQ2448_7764 [Microbotryum intermedium]
MEIGDLPIVTKCYLASAVALSVAVQCNVVTPLQLYFTYRSAFEHGQLWRIATCFMYWGPLGLDFFFHIFFFMRYSKMLEESTFHGRRADYVWLLVVSCTLLLILSPLSPSPFLSSPLSFTLVYLWSRLNPAVRLSLFGIITITAPYLPYALCLFSWALAGGGTGWGMGAIMGDALGLLTGHWWYFWTEVWKRERASGARNWLETPRILVKLFDSPERIQEVEEADRQAALARAQANAATAGVGRR